MLASRDANEEATNKATRLRMPLTQSIRDVGGIRGCDATQATALHASQTRLYTAGSLVHATSNSRYMYSL